MIDQFFASIKVQSQLILKFIKKKKRICVETAKYDEIMKFHICMASVFASTLCFVCFLSKSSTMENILKNDRIEKIFQNSEVDFSKEYNSTDSCTIIYSRTHSKKSRHSKDSIVMYQICTFQISNVIYKKPYRSC